MDPKYVASLRSAERSLHIADHLAYVTYPLIRDNKICLQIISELSISSIYLINSVLQYEYYFKRIRLFSDSNTNMETFRAHCIKPHGFSDVEVKALFEVIRLADAHKKSPMEFVKDKNVVIMTDGGIHTEIINLDRIKAFISVIKGALGKAKKRMEQNRLF